MSQAREELMGRESHGGDSLAVEVIQSMKIGMSKLEKIDGRLPVEREELEATISKLRVIVTNDLLEVEHEGNKQVSTAINFYQNSNTPVIKINRQMWKGMTTALKHALALHELLSLHAIERSFVYSFSSKIYRNILRNELRNAGYICDANFDLISQTELSQLLGSYSYDGGVISFKIFVDYMDNSIKYIYKLKNQMIGEFTTSSDSQLCFNKELKRYYLPMAGSLIELEMSSDNISLFNVIDPENGIRIVFDKN